MVDAREMRTLLEAYLREVLIEIHVDTSYVKNAYFLGRQNIMLTMLGRLKEDASPETIAFYYYTHLKGITETKYSQWDITRFVVSRYPMLLKTEKTRRVAQERLIMDLNDKFMPEAEFKPTKKAP